MATTPNILMAMGTDTGMAQLGGGWPGSGRGWGTR